MAVSEQHGALDLAPCSIAHTIHNTLKNALITRDNAQREMASSQKRTRPSSIETECETEAEKDALAMRLDRMHELLSRVMALDSSIMGRF